MHIVPTLASPIVNREPTHEEAAISRLRTTVTASFDLIVKEREMAQDVSRFIPPASLMPTVLALRTSLLKLLAMLDDNRWTDEQAPFATNIMASGLQEFSWVQIKSVLFIE